MSFHQLCADLNNGGYETNCALITKYFNVFVDKLQAVIFSAQLDEKTISIDPCSLGCVGIMILGEVIHITETSDDEFVSVPDVERQLKKE